MFDQNDRAWIEKSVAAKGGGVEVDFRLQTDFYKGDAKDWRVGTQDTVALPAPVIDGAAKYHLSSREVVQHERDVAAHYKVVLKLAREFGKPLNEICHHFWLRLRLNSERDELTFPWYDTWSEMERLLLWLLSANDGDDWYDIDEGWEMTVVRAGSNFHVREGDGEGVESANVSFKRDELLQSVAELRERIPPIIRRLTDEVGEDLWTA